MKVLLALVLLIASFQVAYTVSANFNTAYSVSTSVTDYSFSVLTLPLLDLNVSSASATGSSTVAVNTYATLPTNSSFSLTVNGGLPAGYVNFGGSLLTGAIGAGFYVNFSSDINTKANAQLIFNPSIFSSGGVNASLIASFRPLYFDVSSGAYYEFPASQYTANLNNGIIINFNSSTYIILAIKLPNLVPIAVSIGNNGIAFANLVANATATFVVNTALTIYNLTAASGNLAIGVANSAATQGSNVVISPIYSFTHSAGGNANINGQLIFDLNSVSVNATFRANAAWYYNNNGNWERQSGSAIVGSTVQLTVTHFSNYSVQSGTSAGGAGAKLEVPSFIKMLTALF